MVSKKIVGFSLENWVVLIIMAFALCAIQLIHGTKVYADPPVIQKLATTLSSNETWNDSSVYVIGEVTVPNGVTLTIEEGTVIKTHTMFSGINGIKVETGGTLIVNGTNSDPVIFTSLKDDSVGGDSGGDGATTGQPGDYGTAVRLWGGVAEIENAIIRYGTKALHADCSYSGTDVEIIDNVFEDSVSIWGCEPSKMTVLRNNFDIDVPTGGLDVKSADLSSIVLAGSNKNTFVGTGNVVYASDSSGVPDGSTWTVSGDSGAVILTNNFDKVEGTLNLEAGAIVKTTGTAFTVGEGGVINSSGTPSDPVIFTSAIDDSAGGVSFDPNGVFGNPEEGDYATAILAQAGSTVSASNTIFKYAVTALKINGGEVELDEGTVLSNATYGLEVTGNAKVGFRGGFEDISNRFISACSWGDGCVVDATYVDWGSADGPFPTEGEDLACGAVYVSPWKVGSTTEQGDSFGVSNCGGNTLPGQFSSNSAYFHQRVALWQIDCTNGFQDACNTITTAYNCISAARDLGESQLPWPMPPASTPEEVEAFGGLLWSGATTYAQTGTAQINLGFITGLANGAKVIFDISNAYSSCAP